MRLREHLILARGSLLGLQNLLRRDARRARRGGAGARLAGDVLHGAARGLRNGEGAGAACALAIGGLHLLQLLGMLLGLLSGWDLRDRLLDILRGCSWLSDGLWMRLPRLWLSLALYAESGQRYMQCWTVNRTHSLLLLLLLLARRHGLPGHELFLPTARNRHVILDAGLPLRLHAAQFSRRQPRVLVVLVVRLVNDRRLSLGCTTG